MAQILDRIRNIIRPYLTKSGRTAATNLFWLSLFTVLTQACSLVVVFVLTKGLTTNNFGILSFALTLQSYFIIFGTAGLPSVVIREGTQHADQLDQITTSYIIISGAFSSVLCVIVVGCTWLAPISSDERMLLCLMAVANIAASVSLRPLFDIHHQQTKSGLIMFAVEVVSLGGFVALYRLNALSLRTAGLMFAGKWTALSLFHFLVYHRYLKRVRLSLSMAILKGIFRSSWVLMVATFVATIPLNSGVLFVRVFNGESDAAIMGIATQVATAFLVFSGIGTRILQPHVAGDFGLHRSFLKKLVFFAFLFLGATMFAFAAAAAAAIWLFLDSGYQAAIVPMSILLVGTSAFWLCAIPKVYLIRLKSEFVIFGITGVTALIFVVISICLVRRFSYLGVALTVLGIGCLSLIAFVDQVRRRVTFLDK